MATTDASMTSRRPTAIRCHTSRTLPRNSRFLQDRPGTWLPPDSGSCRLRQQDCSHHTIRPLRVPSTPFGLKNPAQAFQRLMDTVCNGLGFVFVYLDDILVRSTSAEQHMLHLREVFHRLSSHGLVVNVSKCQFGAKPLTT